MLTPDDLQPTFFDSKILAENYSAMSRRYSAPGTVRGTPFASTTKAPKHGAFVVGANGGPGTRTPHLLLAKQLLYQMS